MADINALMMGGRRAGKTSIMAAMDECCKAVLASDRLLELMTHEGSIEITMKKTELSDYFTDPRYLKSRKFTPDLNPSSASGVFEYECRVGGRSSGFTLNFTDVPGEMYEDASRIPEVEELMGKSQVMIIAIDSPHMMERTGDASEELTGCCKYHESFNRVPEITDFFKTAFQSGKELCSQNKLVILVPLKCEKYYYRNEMKKLYDTILKGYEELLRFLASPGICDICTVAVAPILTLGGAEFFKFVEGKSYVGEYNYVEDRARRAYLPKYCEQPLFLTLQYVISLARRRAEGRFALFRMFSEVFGNKAKLEDLKACEASIRDKIMTDRESGFCVIQDPVKMLG